VRAGEELKATSSGFRRGHDEEAEKGCQNREFTPDRKSKGLNQRRSSVRFTGRVVRTNLAAVSLGWSV
jgi:hypothetical protein